jgi:hypothetical protein
LHLYLTIIPEAFILRLLHEQHLSLIIVRQHVHVRLSQLHVAPVLLLLLLLWTAIAKCVHIALASEILKGRVTEAKVAEDLVGLERKELVLPFGLLSAQDQRSLVFQLSDLLHDA